MRTLRFFLFFTLLALTSLGSCSNDIPKAMKPVPVVPDENTVFNDNDSLSRDLSVSSTCPSFRFRFAPEDSDCDDEATANATMTHLVEDIGCVYGDHSTTKYNYVLVVDSRGLWWDYDDKKKCHIFMMSSSATSGDYGLYSWGDDSDANFYIKDPESCELIEHFTYCALYAIIADNNDDDPRVRVYSIEYNQSTGAILTAYPHAPTHVRTFNTATLGTLGGVTGILYNNVNNDYQIFVCDTENKVVRIFDDGGNEVATLNDFDSGDIPIDVTVVQYSTTEGYLYVAVADSSNRANDYVYVYRGEVGTANQPLDWDEPKGKARPYQQGSYEPFPYLINIAVREYNFHDGLTVVALMKDTDDGYGVIMRQVDFRGETEANCIYYDNDFASCEPDSGGRTTGRPEGLALGNRSGNYFYYVGDRNEDVNSSNSNVIAYGN